MQKNEMIALSVFKTAPWSGDLPRSILAKTARPSSLRRRVCGARVVTKSLRTSRRNGWNVIYDGSAQG